MAGPFFPNAPLKGFPGYKYFDIQLLPPEQKVKSQSIVPVQEEEPLFYPTYVSSEPDPFNEKSTPPGRPAQPSSPALPLPSFMKPSGGKKQVIPAPSSVPGPPTGPNLPLPSFMKPSGGGKPVIPAPSSVPWPPTGPNLPLPSFMKPSGEQKQVIPVPFSVPWPPTKPSSGPTGGSDEKKPVIPVPSSVPSPPPEPTIPSSGPAGASDEKKQVIPVPSSPSLPLQIPSTTYFQHVPPFFLEKETKDFFCHSTPVFDKPVHSFWNSLERMEEGLIKLYVLQHRTQFIHVGAYSVVSEVLYSHSPRWLFFYWVDGVIIEDDMFALGVYAKITAAHLLSNNQLHPVIERIWSLWERDLKFFVNNEQIPILPTEYNSQCFTSQRLMNKRNMNRRMIIVRTTAPKTAVLPVSLWIQTLRNDTLSEKQKEHYFQEWMQKMSDAEKYNLLKEEKGHLFREWIKGMSQDAKGTLFEEKIEFPFQEWIKRMSQDENNSLFKAKEFLHPFISGNQCFVDTSVGRTPHEPLMYLLDCTLLVYGVKSKSLHVKLSSPDDKTQKLPESSSVSMPRLINRIDMGFAAFVKGGPGMMPVKTSPATMAFLNQCIRLLLGSINPIVLPTPSKASTFRDVVSEMSGMEVQTHTAHWNFLMMKRNPQGGQIKVPRKTTLRVSTPIHIVRLRDSKRLGIASMYSTIGINEHHDVRARLSSCVLNHLMEYNLSQVENKKEKIDKNHTLRSVLDPSLVLSETQYAWVTEPYQDMPPLQDTKKGAPEDRRWMNATLHLGHLPSDKMPRIKQGISVIRVYDAEMANNIHPIGALLSKRDGMPINNLFQNICTICELIWGAIDKIQRYCDAFCSYGSDSSYKAWTLVPDIQGPENVFVRFDNNARQLHPSVDDIVFRDVTFVWVRHVDRVKFTEKKKDSFNHWYKKIMLLVLDAACTLGVTHNYLWDELTLTIPDLYKAYLRTICDESYWNPEKKVTPLDSLLPSKMAQFKGPLKLDHVSRVVLPSRDFKEQYVLFWEQRDKDRQPIHDEARHAWIAGFTKIGPIASDLICVGWKIEDLERALGPIRYHTDILRGLAMKTQILQGAYPIAQATSLPPQQKSILANANIINGENGGVTFMLLQRKFRSAIFHHLSRPSPNADHYRSILEQVDENKRKQKIRFVDFEPEKKPVETYAFPLDIESQAGFEVTRIIEEILRTRGVYCFDTI